MDEHTFYSIYEKNARPLWAYLMRVTGHGNIADDVTQETFYRFLSGDPPVMDEAQTRRYLFRIATNLLHDRWRRREDEPFLEAYELSYQSDMDVRIDLCWTLQRLKPKERELLWLAYVEGMSHEEIAFIIGVGAASVRLLLFRARQKAASLLRPNVVKL